jgi:hypothetical protein
MLFRTYLIKLRNLLKREFAISLKLDQVRDKLPSPVSHVRRSSKHVGRTSSGKLSPSQHPSNLVPFIM